MSTYMIQKLYELIISYLHIVASVPRIIEVMLQIKWWVTYSCHPNPEKSKGSNLLITSEDDGLSFKMKAVKGGFQVCGQNEAKESKTHVHSWKLGQRMLQLKMLN